MEITTLAKDIVVIEFARPVPNTTSPEAAHSFAGAYGQRMSSLELSPEELLRITAALETHSGSSQVRQISTVDTHWWILGDSVPEALAWQILQASILQALSMREIAPVPERIIFVPPATGRLLVLEAHEPRAGWLHITFPPVYALDAQVALEMIAAIRYGWPAKSPLGTQEYQAATRTLSLAIPDEFKSKRANYFERVGECIQDWLVKQERYVVDPIASTSEMPHDAVPTQLQPPCGKLMVVVIPAR